MSQISPPMRILLVGSIVFLAAWFAFLKPGGDTDVTPTATTPAVSDPNAKTSTALGSAVQKANGAAAAQTAANAAHGDESKAAAPSTAAPATAAAPAKAPAAAADASKVETTDLGLPARVAKAVASNKILVMLFWNPKAADDRVVRREMRGVGSHHKKDIAVHLADVKDIARYAALVPKASVQQSPSVVVVGKDRHATVLQGYSDKMAIEQAVADALRAAR